MAWISSILKKSDAQVEEDPVLEEVVEEAAHRAPQIDDPQLAVLAPDIGGISSFRLKLFDDAATAELFVEEMHPETRRGTHAFWALHDEPDVPASAHKEALVLIRANLTSNIVYVVSFVDLESAWSFARFEAKRGLDPSHLLVYWAAFAQVREELDTVSIVPPVPPATKNAGVATVEHEALRTVDRYIETQVPEDNLIGTPTESELRARAAAEAGRRAAEAAEAATQAQKLADLAKQAETEAADRAEAARQTEAHRLAEEERNKAILEAAREAEQERLLAEAETVRQAEDERIAMQAESARRAEQARVRAEAAAMQEAEAERIAAEAEAAQLAEEVRLEAQAQARLEADAARLAFAEPVITGKPQVATPPEPVTSYPGDEETDSDTEDASQPAASGTVFTHGSAEAIADQATIEIPDHLRKKTVKEKRDSLNDPTAEFPTEPTLDEFDIAYEVERLLRNRRWEKREEPFGGFSSPPGRF